MYGELPFFTFQQLKNGFPSKARGRSWKAELKYRNECRDIILACGPPLHITTFTLHKGVVLLHRCLTRLTSTNFEKLDKWALATACVFLATKMDSTYHSLNNVTHVSYRALREKQGRPFDPEYFRTDGTPGNEAFLENLCQKVRDAEMSLMFAINFDFNVEVASSIVVYQLRELGLTDALGKTNPQVGAVRATAMKLCVNSIITPGSVLHLMYPARHIALAAISAACKQHGYSVSLQGNVDGCVPAISTQELSVVEDDLMKRIGGGSRAGTPAPSGLSGAAAAAAAASSDVPGTPAGPSSAVTAAPGTPAGPAAPAGLADAGTAAAAATGVASRRRSSYTENGAGLETALGGMSRSGPQGEHGGSLRNSSAATVAAAGVGSATLRQVRTSAGTTAADADAGLADEWFQLLGDGAAAVDQNSLGFHKVEVAAAAGVSQAGDASALEASTVGPRMNNPSPNSFDSLTGPQGAAREQQQQQQGGMQRKRSREDGAAGILPEPLQKRGGMVAA